MFKIYVNGMKKEKMALQNNHPDELKTIQDVLNLRVKHMVKGLPSKYVFHLVCSCQEGCIHPECKGGPPDVLPVWYPGGPPASFLPMSVPDIERYVHVYAKYNRIACISIFFVIYLSSHLITAFLILFRSRLRWEYYMCWSSAKCTDRQSP